MFFLYFNVLNIFFPETCVEACVNGVCDGRRCSCYAGWTGERCDALACNEKCYVNGHCVNGSCFCNQGWNGRHCNFGELRFGGSSIGRLKMGRKRCGEAEMVGRDIKKENIFNCGIVKNRGNRLQ